jgi:hypothetical protein
VTQLSFFRTQSEAIVLQAPYLALFGTVFALIVVYMGLVLRIEFRLRRLRRTPEGAGVPELFSPFDQFKVIDFLLISQDYRSLPDAVVIRWIPVIRRLFLLILPLWLVAFFGPLFAVFAGSTG